MDIQSASATALIVLVAAMAFGDTLPPDARKRAVELSTAIDGDNGPITMSKVRNLRAEDSELLRSYYRDVLDDYNRGGLRGDDMLLKLAMLGDPEARDRTVASWARGRGAEGEPKVWQPPDDLLRLESPEAIAQIGELLFMNEKDQMPGDVGYIAPQSSAFLVVANTLQKSPAFSDAVRGWAGQLYQVRNNSGWAPKNALEVTRRWYRENEALLKRGDFEAVQPGPAPAREEAADATSAPSPVVAPASANVVATSETKPASQPASTSSEWTFAVIAAGCVALLVGLLFFWKRHA